MRFVNVLDALEFRKKGSFLARNREEGYVGLYFGPCTTLSTRIRCDVSRHFSTQIMFSSRFGEKSSDPFFVLVS